MSEIIAGLNQLENACFIDGASEENVAEAEIAPSSKFAPDCRHCLSECSLDGTYTIQEKSMEEERCCEEVISAELTVTGEMAQTMPDLDAIDGVEREDPIIEAETTVVDSTIVDDFLK